MPSNFQTLLKQKVECFHSTGFCPPLHWHFILTDEQYTDNVDKSMIEISPVLYVLYPVLYVLPPVLYAFSVDINAG